VDLSYVSIEGKSRNYRITLAILAALSVIGLVCFAISYVQGHQLFGTSNVIPWGLPIVVAIFLIGLSAGLHILAFLIYIIGQEKYKQVIKAAVFLAVVLIFGAMIAIAVDLGRPEKFWRLFMLFYMNNMTSMFALNAIFYSSYFVSAFIYLIALLTDRKKLSFIMGMVAFGFAMLTHGGTGAIFGFIAARETWFSSLAPFEFIFAAFASSMALLILVLLIIYKTTDRKIDWKMIGSLGGLLKFFLIGLIILMVINELTHLYPAGRDAIMYMISGPYSWLFWGFQVFLGMLIPLFLLYYRKTKNSATGIVLATVLVVIGIAVKRYYLVIPGAAYPQHYYPGNIEGVYGAIGHFTFTPVEVGWAIGMFAFLVAIFLLGLRYMKLLPAKEAEESFATVEASSTEAYMPSEPSATPEASAPPDIETSPKADSPPGAE
jgi:Ni/Fe-hydrogenase subunit HybB-like protein